MRVGKPDTISGRAFNECMRRYGSVKMAAYKLGANEDTIRRWRKDESDPGAKLLRAMCLDGCDLYYIIMGRRSDG